MMKWRLAANKGKYEDFREQHQVEFLHNERQHEKKQQDCRRGPADRAARQDSQRFVRRAVAAGLGLLRAENSPWTDDQNDGHHQVHQEKGNPGKHENPEGIQFADDRGCQKCPNDAPHAANDDDNEDAGDDGKVHVVAD